MTNPLRAALLLTVAAILTACGGAPVQLPTKEPAMSMAEARQQITAIVGETLAAVAPGKPIVPGSLDGSESECSDLRGYTGTFRRTYAREARGLDEAAIDAAERRITELWAGRSMTVRRVEGPPGLFDLDGTMGDLEFQARVSQPGHRVLVRGTTPCLPPA